MLGLLHHDRHGERQGARGDKVQLREVWHVDNRQHLCVRAPVRQCGRRQFLDDQSVRGRHMCIPVRHFCSSSWGSHCCVLLRRHCGGRRATPALLPDDYLCRPHDPRLGHRPGRHLGQRHHHKQHRHLLFFDVGQSCFGHSRREHHHDVPRFCRHCQDNHRSGHDGNDVGGCCHQLDRGDRHARRDLWRHREDHSVELGHLCGYRKRHPRRSGAVFVEKSCACRFKLCRYP
mmetsp:Transcript_51613/g.144960  ORF Transcript_51613/g.144960 Transcript_51613/m.144960 type:complete len:231 (+) Transcript_51613:531-1223(+)